MQDELMTIKEVAQHFRVTPQTVRRWITQGQLTAIDLTAQTIRIPIEDVIALELRPKKCEACGDTKVRISKHHWFDTEGKRYQKWLCNSCNAILHSENGNHILPSWEKQLEILESSPIFRCHKTNVINHVPTNYDT